MPKTGSVGHSDITPTKQRHLKEILDTHIRIVKAIQKKWSEHKWAESEYAYFDIYAGPGRINGDFGSPIIFIDLAKKYKIPYQATLIENNKDTYQMLESAIVQRYGEGLPKHILSFGDNEEILKRFINNPPFLKQFGLLYADPNGCPNFESIAKISNIKQYEKMDILINCPAAAQKRALKIPKCTNHTQNLSEELLKINKNYWIIREPYGSWQWSFLIGTNWDSFPEFSHLGFYRLSSDRGREILTKLTHTARELEILDAYGHYQEYADYLEHPLFLFTKKEVFARAKGKCEICKIYPPTEPHHKVYPKWGTFEFDNPENLIAVCHKCHCKIHGKEN